MRKTRTFFLFEISYIGIYTGFCAVLQLSFKKNQS